MTFRINKYSDTKEGKKEEGGNTQNLKEDSRRSSVGRDEDVERDTADVVDFVWERRTNILPRAIDGGGGPVHMCNVHRGPEIFFLYNRV